MDLVAAKIPQDLVLTLINIQNDTMTLKGTAGSEIGVANS